jgi:hypothetical protein
VSRVIKRILAEQQPARVQVEKDGSGWGVVLDGYVLSIAPTQQEADSRARRVVHELVDGLEKAVMAGTDPS